MVHNDSRRLWEKRVWQFPLIHNIEFGFGLSADSANQGTTVQPWFFQDNALIDYELIKTNPENADFAVDTTYNTMAGSYIPKVQVSYLMYIPHADLEIVHLNVDRMVIHTSMLNRLDAFDKKTSEDVETLLDFTHETTDEQAHPAYNGAKLFELGGTYDLPYPKTPGLSTDGQPEGTNFDKEKWFDAMSYYTNKEMLKLVSDRLRTTMLSEPIIPHGSSVFRFSRTMDVPSLCKFQHPYTYCGEMFHVPQTGTKWQYHIATDTTALEHVRVKGHVRFFEYNPDFNMARA